MLIIEIHVDTIENADTSSSTRPKREDKRSAIVKNNSISTGNRFWNAIKVSIPGSLVQKKNTRDE